MVKKKMRISKKISKAAISGALYHRIGPSPGHGTAALSGKERAVEKCRRIASIYSATSDFRVDVSGATSNEPFPLYSDCRFLERDINRLSNFQLYMRL